MFNSKKQKSLNQYYKIVRNIGCTLPNWIEIRNDFPEMTGLTSFHQTKQSYG